MFEHIRKLKAVSYFAAPAGRQVTPATIVLNSECIELVTGGTIFFETGGERKTFRKGAMFWHVSREKTIWDTPPDDPYRCYVFRFEARPPTRTVPRVTVWNNPDEALEFASAMFKVFHSGDFDQDALTAYLYSTLRWQALASLRQPAECRLCALLGAERIHDYYLSDAHAPAVCGIVSGGLYGNPSDC